MIVFNILELFTAYFENYGFAIEKLMLFEKLALLSTPSYQYLSSYQ
jgi:hypothetical protein